MKMCRRLIRLLDSTVNLVVLSILLLLLSYGCYAVWDSQQLYAAADSTQYEVYKPASENRLSFDKLQEINPEVFGWLTIYGTNIDYPLVQGSDNERYVNTAADGTYSLSGSLFLDYRNQNDFSDFNSIIYGHHMDQKVMFGEIADFKEAAYFEGHQYGTLYYAGKEHGIEFLAFLEIDAYDALYQPGVVGADGQKTYLDRIRENARNFREFTATEDQHFVLLSTCTSDVTNGRHVLVGRITDEVYDDPFYREPEEAHLTGIDEKDTLWEHLQNLPLWQQVGLIFLILILLLSLTVCVIYRIRRNIKRRRGNV